MSKLVELYIKAKKSQFGRYQTKEEFMIDMNRKEHKDRLTGHGLHTVRFAMYIGEGEGRQKIQEQHSFEDLRGIYDRVTHVNE